MPKRKRQQATVEELLDRPWCFYCERDFDDLKILISHQKAKHYKCSLCTRRLNTAGGLSVHMSQVHKEMLTSIENALPNRSDVNTEIFGMEGIPDDVLALHRQRITTEYFKVVAERQAETGNPPAGSGQSTQQKKPKLETPEELKQRLAEHKAKREAERLGKTAGDRGSVTPSSNTGPFAAPGAEGQHLQDSPGSMGQGQGSPFTAQSPFPGPGQPPGLPPGMSPVNPFYGPPGSSPMGPGFGMPSHMPPHMPPHMSPHGLPVFPGGHSPFPPPPGVGAPLFHPMHQHMPRPGGPPFVNGHQHSPVPQTQFKMPPQDQSKQQQQQSLEQSKQQQQSTLVLDVPGLPQRPSASAPNFNREDMARLHAGAPARQVSTSHAALPSPGGATDQAVDPTAAGNVIDNTSARESMQNIPVPVVGVDAHNDATTSTAVGQVSSAPYTPDKLQAALPDGLNGTKTSDGPSGKATKAISTKKGGKKSSKGADRESRMVYTDDAMSPEEKRAAFPRYAFHRDDSTTYVLGDAGPAVTGTVRGSDDVMDTQAAH